MTTSDDKSVTWRERVGQWWRQRRLELANLLRIAFSNTPPAGDTVPYDHKFIDDGVNYDLPFALPQSLLGDDTLRLQAQYLRQSQQAISGGKLEGALLESTTRNIKTLSGGAGDPEITAAITAFEEGAAAIEAARNDYIAQYAKSLREADSVYHFQFDKPYLYNENMSQFPTADPLREWDWQGSGGGGTGGPRKDILSRCHLAFERNPIANTAVTLTTQFCIGEGLTITYKNKEVEEILEAFRANCDNAVDEFEKSFLNDLQIDGELFIRFAKDAEGNTVIYPLKPWEIWWIQADRKIKRRIESFHWVAGLTSGVPGDFQLEIEDIAADDILFVAINRASYDARGKSELFRILPWLKAYKDWLEGRARQNHWRGSVLWDVSLVGATPGQVTNKRAQYRQPPPPGSMAIHNDKEVWSVLENKSSASDVAEDGRQIKLMAAVGKKFPEYMLGDGENANKATSNAQELPVLRSFTDFQDIAVNGVWGPIYKRVIQNAIEAGLLTEEVEEQDADGESIRDKPNESNDSNGKSNESNDPTGYTQAGGKLEGKPKTLKAIDAFSLSAPELEVTDPKNLGEALTLARNNGWVSDETAAGRMGFDYRTEKKKMASEMKEKGELAAQGGMMPNDPRATFTDPNEVKDFPEKDKEK